MRFTLFVPFRSCMSGTIGQIEFPLVPSPVRGVACVDLPAESRRAKRPCMPRYALKLEYHGAPFAGWQRQRDQPSVQAAVESALARLEPGPHSIGAAGRTDAGVHALAQVAHCDLGKEWTPFRLSEALNHHLKPDPVAITACARVAPDWHARFSALERRYFFRLLMRRAPATLVRGLVWQVPHTLDAEAMRSAARHLVGHHDFTTFRSSICQAASPVKTLDALEITGTDGLAGPELWF